MLTDEPEGDGVTATVWRILRQSYLALILDGTGNSPASMTLPEQNLVLNPYFRRLESDVKMIEAVFEHAISSRLGMVQVQLHAAPGLDHEMVDEAVAWAVGKEDDEGHQ